MDDATPRLALPLLQAGQAEKEILHNEALALLDGLVAGTVAAIGLNAPPASPATGQSWIVGTAPTGDWIGHAGEVAIRTEGGWRFAAPVEGMRFRLAGSGYGIERTGTGWSDGTVAAPAYRVAGDQVVGGRQAAIPAPAGGTMIDTEARTAITAILVALKTHGLIDP